MSGWMALFVSICLGHGVGRAGEVGMGCCCMANIFHASYGAAVINRPVANTWDKNEKGKSMTTKKKKRS